MTSAGLSAGIDLSLHVIRKDFGAAAGARVARHMVARAAPRGRPGAVHRAPAMPADPAGGSLEPTRRWAAERLAEPLDVAAMARHAGGQPAHLRPPLPRGDRDDAAAVAALPAGARGAAPAGGVRPAGRGGRLALPASAPPPPCATTSAAPPRPRPTAYRRSFRPTIPVHPVPDARGLLSRRSAATPGPRGMPDDRRGPSTSSACDRHARGPSVATAKLAACQSRRGVPRRGPSLAADIDLAREAAARPARRIGARAASLSRRVIRAEPMDGASGGDPRRGRVERRSPSQTLAVAPLAQHGTSAATAAGYLARSAARHRVRANTACDAVADDRSAGDHRRPARASPIARDLPLAAP